MVVVLYQLKNLGRLWLAYTELQGDFTCFPMFIYYRPRSREIIELVASVRLSVRLPLPVQGYRLCVCNQSACAGNCAEAVDRLLFYLYLPHHTFQTRKNYHGARTEITPGNFNQTLDRTPHTYRSPS